MNHYVYILECSDHSYYTGYTNDLMKRLTTHNKAKGAKYTKARLPVKLVYFEHFDVKSTALKKEYAIKQLTRKAKEELIMKGKAMKYILFDLDGTLTDSGEGIIKSVIHALNYYDIHLDLEDLKTFVGPPLSLSFKKYGIPDDEIEHAIKLFRDRYLTVGKFENHPYPGIIAMLEELKKEYKLFVATSKPEVTAIEILKHFDMDQYFEKIAGATSSHERETKHQVIDYLLNTIGDEHQFIMVGDTAFDVIGAKKAHIETIGVSWGYGKIEDLEKAGAIAIAKTPEELKKLLECYPL